jgi:uncharacterized membrane protein
MGGTPPEVLASAELMRLLLPSLRADFELCERYAFVEEAPLDVPVVAFAGTHDAEAPVDDVRAWSRHTTAETTLHRVVGGHFFVHEAERVVCGLLAAELRRGMVELGESRTGYGTPIAVALGATEDGVLAALPIAPELRADPGAVSERGGALAAAASLFVRPLLVPALGVALGLLPVPSLAGHALDPNQPAVSAVADVLHVGAAGAWLGGLLALGIAVPFAAATLDGVRRGRLYAAVARRFSVVTAGLVALLAGTGLVRALYELARVSQLWNTGYGRAIVVKSVLLVALLAIVSLWHVALQPRRVVPRSRGLS